LQRILAHHAALACTSGTGVLPLCDVAAATWREVPSAPPWIGHEAPPGTDQPEDLPVDRIPPPLRATINDLHARLGYPPLKAGPIR